MARTDYYHDPGAPKANTIVPAVTAVVVNDEGAVLLQRRRDNDLWALPGGAIDIGETVTQAVVREVKEETGLDVRVTRLIGIYSDPEHIIAYDDGEIRQQFSICFAASPHGGQMKASGESTEIRFVPRSTLDSLQIHVSNRLRIAHFYEQLPQPYVG